MEHIRIAKKTYALAFTMDALATMEKLVPGFDLSQVTDHARTSGGLVDLLWAMAQQGELLEGRTLEEDRAWFGSHLSPSPKNIVKLQIACMNALAEGLRMETEEEDEDAEVDVVLEDIKKKDGNTD